VLLNSPLTPRESQVVKLLAEGKSNKEEASTLGVSPPTIESHRNHIMHKMNFASFRGLIRFALRSRVVDRQNAREATLAVTARRDTDIHAGSNHLIDWDSVGDDSMHTRNDGDWNIIERFVFVF
jgi:DNA-binding CsgD family transcriptional regulator